MHGNKERIKNIVLNLVGALFSTGIMQLIVNPYLAQAYSESEFGTLLFYIGLLNVAVLMLGNALGDIRMITNNGYEEDGLSGDFNLLITICSIAAGVIFGVLGVTLIHMTTVGVILLSATAVIETLKTYLVMFFRLKLQYWRCVVSAVVTGVGYVVGIALAELTGEWVVIFLMGNLFPVLYMLVCTPFVKEPFCWTPRVKNTTTQFGMLSFSYGLKSGLTYVDRFILYPMLGAEMVSIYTVATVLGKCVSLVIQPVANVMLGYMAQRGFKMSMKLYMLLIIASMGLGAVAYLAINIFSAPIIGLIYPTYHESVMPYLALANLSAIITAICAIIQPVVLKYAKMHWQIMIQSVYAILIVVAAIILIPIYSLMGFCWAALVAAVVKLVMMFLIGIVCLEKNEKETV